jgi:hypothetical protein
MSIAAKIRRAPLRLTTGAFIFNSGIEKLTSTDDDAAKMVHGLAAGTYPFVAKVNPRAFQKALGAGEIALGAVLVLPIFPASVAGLGLLGFSGSLLGVYWKTPGMHIEGSIRPTQQGVAIAKDSWMFGAGAALVLDAFLQGAHDVHHDKAGPAVSAKASEARAAIVAGATTAAAAVGSALADAKDVVVEKAPVVKDALATAGESIADKASAAASVVAEKTQDNAPVVKDALIAAGSAIAANASSAASVIADKAGDTASSVSDYASDAGSAVAAKTPSGSDIASFWDTARSRVAERAAAAVDAGKKSDTVKSVRKAAKGYRKDAKKSAKHLRKAAEESGKDLRSSAKDYAKTFRKEAKKSASSALDSAKSTVDSITK